MIKFNLWICFASILFLFGACGDSKQVDANFSANGKVFITLDEAFRFEDCCPDVTISSVSDAILDSAGNLFVLDAEPGNPNTFFAVDPFGNRLWTISDQGVAPGELRDVQGFTLVNDSLLFLANQFGSRLDAYSITGQFLDSKLVSELGTDMLSIVGTINETTLVGTKPIFGRLGVKVLLVETDPAWSIADTFSVNLDSEMEVDPMVGIRPNVSVIGNLIVVAGLEEYNYLLFDINGKLLQNLSRSDIKITPPIISGSGFGVSITQLSEIFPLKSLNGDLVVGGGRWPKHSINQKTYISDVLKGLISSSDREMVTDIFNVSTGMHLSSINSNKLGELIASDMENGLYFAAFDQHSLKISKYKIIGLPSE